MHDMDSVTLNQAIQRPVERGVPIRSLSRGLHVLSAISNAGPLSMTKIAQASNIPYPTAFRIVQTFIHEGMVEREPGRKVYRVTALVKSLSTGFQDEDLLARVARPHMEKLCEEVRWPVSLATRVGTRMMVRESTHRMTPMTFTNYFPGYTLPIANCATGKAYLAFCDEAERASIIDSWAIMENEASRYGEHLVEQGHLLDQIRSDGHAFQIRNEYNADPGKTSAIAVPIQLYDGELIGCLGMIYFDKALKPAEVAEQFSGQLQHTAKGIAGKFAKAQ